MVAQRNPEQTRMRILEAAFDIIYRHGYQGMRIDQVLKATDLAKGALYHHFKNKQSLGYAIVDELLLADVQRRWLTPLAQCEDPLIGIKQILDQESENASIDELTLGCPLNNLSQEMAGIDLGFKERLTFIYTSWSEAISSALSRGIETGHVRATINPEISATFIISSMQGIIGTVKCMQDKTMMIALKNELVNYIMSLRN